MALAIHGQLVTNPANTKVMLFLNGYSSFVVSKIFVCNPDGAGRTFKLWAVPSAIDTVTDELLLYGSTAIGANTTFVVPGGITLGIDDAIYVEGSSATMVVTLFGEGVGE